MGVEWEKEINRRVEALAQKQGRSMAQIALGACSHSVVLSLRLMSSSVAWVLHKDSVSAPIVGISNMERFEEVIGALDVKFSDDELKYLEEPYQP